MNNEIEEGEFVRTKDGYIAKVIEIDEDGDYYTFDNYVQVDHGDKFYSLYKEELKNIRNHSKNKIELVEVGDYVNGILVVEVLELVLIDKKHQEKIVSVNRDKNCTLAPLLLTNNDIKTLLTKEAFKEREYVF